MESASLTSRFRSAWNAFRNRDPTGYVPDIGPSLTYRVDRLRFTRGNERSIVTSVYNKIALDAAQTDIKHCDIDTEGRYLSDRVSGLNTCLTLEANIDQTNRAFMHDAVASMLDEGHVALVPVETDRDPTTGAFDVLTLRTGKVTKWYPQNVEVYLYNELTGRNEHIILPKSAVGIVENPFYAVMNEPNSTMKRLVEKLNILDAIDKQSGSGKLDLIIQLPFAVKTATREAQANKRIQAIEEQLKRPYGIAYADATERITQLNRPVENNLMKQIEYLTNMLYSQLGITQSILDGTADEQTMLNYYTRTIEPIISAIVDEMKRKFLSKTARTQGQSILWFRDHFKLVPIGKLADVTNAFAINKILSANEIRQIIGRKPSSDPEADQLGNGAGNQPTKSNIDSPGTDSSEASSKSDLGGAQVNEL